MKRVIFLAFVWSVILPCLIFAQSFKTETGHAEFESSVPLHSFVGTSDHLVGQISLQDSIVDFYLDLTTLDTGNNKRDKDMRETLETDSYPFAEFYGKIVSPFDPDKSEPQPATVEGEFSIHNVTKEVTIEGFLQKTPDGLQLETEWTLNMTDYNIEPPGILFYRVEENIDIKIEALLKPLNQ